MSYSDVVPKVAGKSRAQVELEGQNFLRKNYSGAVNRPTKINVIDLYEIILPRVYGLKTYVADLHQGVEGMTFPDGTILLSPQTYEEACIGDARARFTITHEAYHGIYHRKQLVQALYDFSLTLARRSNIKPFEDPEWQADAFSASVLMPAPAIRYLAREHNWKRPYSQYITQVVRAFGVSFSAAETRLKHFEEGKI